MDFIHHPVLWEEPDNLLLHCFNWYIPNYYYFISGLCPSSGILESKQCCRHWMFPSSGGKVGNTCSVGSLRNNYPQLMIDRNNIMSLVWDHRLFCECWEISALRNKNQNQKWKTWRISCSVSLLVLWELIHPWNIIYGIS